LRIGLTQLGEEGAIQVFRPHLGGALILGAIGQLQFEVVAHRLQHEYGVDARFASARYQMARWVTSEDPVELRRFIEANDHRIAYDSVDAPTFLVTYKTDLTVAQERWKKLEFHALREHAGLVFQQQPACAAAAAGLSCSSSRPELQQQPALVAVAASLSYCISLLGLL
ncbi:MAG TPA: hypothetical protein VEY30_01760, partial [Myxococcaceae bacterium]|nr:hypothetical protein [Myxococcaceae bacterium]